MRNGRQQKKLSFFQVYTAATHYLLSARAKRFLSVFALRNWAKSEMIPFALNSHVR